MNWGHNANSFLLGFCIDFSFFPFLSQFCITYPYSTLMHVKLCGHATLASAHSLFMVNSNIIEFDTLSGILTAKTVPDVNPAYVSKIQNGGVHEYFLIKLNFPSVPITEFNSAEVSAISKALNGAPPIDIKRTTTADDLFDPVCGSANCALAPYWTQMPKSVISLHMRYLSLSFPLNHSRKPMLLSLTLSY
ncbi:uncharacterized protein LOC111283279 isoform X3 [Durio zibethinus]|uniref:Uncharacterized protein LOC111283279 isoform X3 n=1 Tax=Durio zibethinus TaxID=66656 RepID=A0A6P5XHX5_DURZI|nr:uncharacterized protein LOC111283279 isoform X3 [Durio zibethinus]